MSQSSVERILGKALLDSDFRNALLENPEQALSGFSLTSNEKNYLKRMDSETLDQLAKILEERHIHWRNNSGKRWPAIQS